MMRLPLLMILCGLLSSPVARAEGFDYQWGGSARSYPVGARTSALLGFSKELWSSEDPAEPRWKFGYVRPFLVAESSYFVNRGIAELEFFPISILGFAVGSSVSSRGGYDFAGFDCDRSQCDGTLRKNYARGQLALAAGGFSFVLKHRVDWFKSNHRDRPFVDELSALEGLPGRDELRSWTGLFGYGLAPRWTSGLAYDTQRFTGSRARNEGLYLFLSGGRDGFQGVVGAGAYRSTHQRLEPSLFVDFRWIGRKGPGLLD